MDAGSSTQRPHTEAIAASASIVDPALGPSARGRLRLSIEFAVLYLAGPFGVLLLLKTLAGALFPVLLVLAALILVILWRDPTFDRRQFLWGRALRHHGRAIRHMLLMIAVFALIAAVAVYVLEPTSLFSLPRDRPRLWLAIMLLYPLLSVYPQELFFRTFLFHRYAPLFQRPVVLIAASAISFALAHLAFNNWLAIALTLIGGLLFAITYHRARSTLLVSLEHALYGCVIFTVGLGRSFYLGAS